MQRLTNPKMPKSIRRFVGTWRLHPRSGLDVCGQFVSLHVKQSLTLGLSSFQFPRLNLLFGLLNERAVGEDLVQKQPTVDNQCR